MILMFYSSKITTISFKNDILVKLTEKKFYFEKNRPRFHVRAKICPRLLPAGSSPPKWLPASSPLFSKNGGGGEMNPTVQSIGFLSHESFIMIKRMNLQFLHILIWKKWRCFWAACVESSFAPSLLLITPAHTAFQSRVVTLFSKHQLSGYIFT